MQRNNVFFPVFVVKLHAIGMQLALAGFFVRKFQVINRDDLLEKISNSFHVCLLVYLDSSGLRPTKTVRHILFSAAEFLFPTYHPEWMIGKVSV